MALSKIQSIIKQLSESQNVKRVIGDIQTLSEDIQKRVQSLNTDQAVKKYKEIMKKVTETEADLEKEVNKVITQIKKSATEVEKNLGQYKKKAIAQKTNLEKIIKGKKTTSGSRTAKKASSTARSKKMTAAAPMVKKATAKKSVLKKAVRK